jgi:hypothetical protein
MIVIGLYYKNICYINELIPIWMIVFGAVGAFIIILRFISDIYSKCRYKYSFIIFCFLALNNIYIFKGKIKAYQKLTIISLFL